MTVLTLRKFSGTVATWPEARLFRSIGGESTYAYFEGFEEGLKLVRSLSIEGASAGQAAPFRYVVETDVLPEAEADFVAWYAQEHLPGLAAVPGVVKAEQFIVERGAPRFHSVYDLMSTETFGSPAWLAVRGTAWSDRVRPTFRNAIRTMFSAI